MKRTTTLTMLGRLFALALANIVFVLHVNAQSVRQQLNSKDGIPRFISFDNTSKKSAKAGAINDGEVLRVYLPMDAKDSYEPLKTKTDAAVLAVSLHVRKTVRTERLEVLVILSHVDTYTF